MAEVVAASKDNPLKDLGESIIARVVAEDESKIMPANVYYTKYMTPESITSILNILTQHLPGKVAIKIHTGEPDGPNILPRDLVKAVFYFLGNARLVETNTAYGGARYTTEEHRKTISHNGWDFGNVDILDENGGVAWSTYGGKYLKEVDIGKSLENYDSLLVLTHFKGHAYGGYGGSLKNIAIGCATGKLGKYQVHGYRGTHYPPHPEDWENHSALKEEFMERMADCGSAILHHFGKNIAYINVMRNMSVDCDCAGTNAALPTIPDLGIVGSTNLVAVDKASLDLVMQQDKENRADLEERIASRHGFHQIKAMENLKLGTSKYKLINIDSEVKNGTSIRPD